jgi:carbon storage regulator
VLVLTRRRGEAIVIGGDIEVTVLEVHGERVKLGISGPADVPIRREEVSRPFDAMPIHRPRCAPNHSTCRRGQIAKPLVLQ